MFGSRWEDLSEADRTILIRDCKDPCMKIGNNQTAPLYLTLRPSKQAAAFDS